MKIEKFPKENYVKIHEAYEKIKGVKPMGNEWNIIDKNIKMMFQAGRTMHEIIDAMEVCNNLYDDWTMNTIRMKIADVSAKKLQSKDEWI